MFTQKTSFILLLMLTIHRATTVAILGTYSKLEVAPIHNCLMVSTILKNISQLGRMTSHHKKTMESHKPVMFQPTNQIWPYFQGISPQFLWPEIWYDVSVAP
jgi:hypothetical protein